MLSFDEAVKYIKTPDELTLDLLALANKLRLQYKGNKIKLCSIINAKSGKCSENCSFCGQSAHFKTKVDSYPLWPPAEMVTAAQDAEKEMQATCFSIVTSGKGIQDEKEIGQISEAVKGIKEKTKLNRCVSAGVLDEKEIQSLKDSGLNKLHHNLETAESFFDKVCTTHSYQERIDTIKTAKKLKMQVCSGGIFGLGETPEQRVELAFTLKELGVDSVPLNILHPIEGTRAAENYKSMTPFDVLRLIAVYRLILPTKDIGLLGGREYSLRDLQPLMFMAGANVILIGNYLTTPGQAYQKDLQMIKDLGLEIER